MKPENVEVVKQIGDGLSVITAIGTLVQLLPSVAALFTIIWTGMRIAEMVAGKPFSEIIRRKKVDDAERQ
jgi:hypothetical protein